MKFRHLIVDDEPLARKLIQSHTAKVDALEEVGVCGSAIEAANVLQKTSVDLIFLDIQMPELTGLAFVKSLKQPPAIILTTAHREFAAEAFELDIVDYLVKPISFDRFLKGVNRFIATREISKVPANPHDEASIHLKVDRKIFPVTISDILFVESLDSYVKVHLKDKILVTHENISSLEGRLPGTFVRIHRSFIINARYIESISGEGIQVGGKELPFGRAFKQMALSRLGMNPG